MKWIEKGIILSSFIPFAKLRKKLSCLLFLSISPKPCKLHELFQSYADGMPNMESRAKKVEHGKNSFYRKNFAGAAFASLLWLNFHWKFLHYLVFEGNKLIQGI